MGNNKVEKGPDDEKRKVKDDYKRPPSVSQTEKVKKNYQEPASVNIHDKKFSLERFFRRIFKPDAPESNYKGTKPGQNARDREKTPGTKYKGNTKVPFKPGNIAEKKYSGNKPKKRSKKKEQSPGTNFKGGRKGLSPFINREESKYTGHKSAKRAGKPDQSKGTTHKGNTKHLVPKINVKEADYKGNVARKEIEKPSPGTSFEGNIKLKKYNKDLHPSAAYWNARRIKSQQKKQWYRKFRRWWTGLWKNEDQPEQYQEKKRKPRYDKEESKIWNE